MAKLNKFKESLKSDIEAQQTFLTNSITSATEHYSSQTTLENKKYLCYLTAAIYTTFKDLFPELDIKIPFRIKSSKSTQKNFQKEFLNSLNSVDSSSLDSLENSFNTSDMLSDINGITIVLNNISETLALNPNYSNNEEIQKLKNIRKENLIYIEELENNLSDSLVPPSETVYYEYYQELLKRIIDSTYSQFTEERELPYNIELENVQNNYSRKLTDESFLVLASDKQLDNLNYLISDLRSRLDDKLQTEILKQTLPFVFSNPLISNGLGANFKFKKENLKPNGFAALYYTNSKASIEIQAQSKRKYEESKKGSAYHSGIPGKQININSFFELVNSEDENSLDYYANILDSIPADELEPLYSFPVLNKKRSYQKALKISDIQKHIKLKDTIKFYKADGTYNEMSLDHYLLNLAQHISPFMYVCTCADTTFSNTANINNKDLIEEFTEILRKKDSTTCLSQMLINKLSQVVKSQNIQNYNLPKQISIIDIYGYIQNEYIPSKQKQTTDDKEI